MRLGSSAFEGGGTIPERHGYYGDNVSPPLEIGDVPPDAESLALVVDDPDAVEPAGKVWDHWVMWGIPPATERIEEGGPVSGAIEGVNDFGENGYGGPAPPDGEHTYRFRLYALDTGLDLPPSAGKAELEDAMEDHVLESVELTGRFAPGGGRS